MLDCSFSCGFAGGYAGRFIRAVDFVMARDRRQRLKSPASCARKGAGSTIKGALLMDGADLAKQ